MNEQQAKAAEYAEILLAFSRGEKIEHKPKYGDCRWMENQHPAWNFAGFEHRIAPKPVERWVVLTNDDCVLTWKKHKIDAENIASHNGGRVALMREVME